MAKFLQICGFLALTLILFYVVSKLFTTLTFEDSESILVDLQTQTDFYSNAYSHLISTHVGLFTALIAVAIAVFGFQKWFDHKEIEDFKKNLPKDIKDIVDGEKPKIVTNIEGTLSGKIKTVVDAKIRDNLQMMINVTLQSIEGDGKEKYCRECIKMIWNEKKIYNSAEGADFILCYHLIMTKLFGELKSVERDSLREDSLMGAIVDSINKDLCEMKTNNWIKYQHFAGLAKSIAPFV